MLTDTASDLIRQLVRDRKFGTSDVMNEVALSQQLGMSRTPVRAALVRLEDAGLVEKLPGRGWRVKPLTREDIEEIFQLKTALEILGVQIAAKRISPDQGNHLMTILARLESAGAANDIDEWLKGDAEFHAFIVEIADNARLKTIVNMLNDQWYRLRPAYMTISGRAQAASAEHRFVAEALIMHDCSAATEAARQHMEKVHRLVRQVMDTILDLVGGNTL